MSNSDYIHNLWATCEEIGVFFPIKLKSLSGKPTIQHLWWANDHRSHIHGTRHFKWREFHEMSLIQQEMAFTLGNMWFSKHRVHKESTRLIITHFLYGKLMWGALKGSTKFERSLFKLLNQYASTWKAPVWLNEHSRYPNKYSNYLWLDFATVVEANHLSYQTWFLHW